MQRRLIVTASLSLGCKLWLQAWLLILTLLFPGLAKAGYFVNISTRGFVGAGDNAMIGGFIIEDAPMTVLIRAVGPSLALPPFNVSGVLANPTVQLVDGPATIGFNDNWQQATNWLSIPEGLRPTNNLESAILMELSPGAYTAIVRGVSDTTGIGLVEVIKIGSSSGKFRDISTRGFVDTGDKVMIGGFVINDDPMTVLIRALGPTLALPPYNVPSALANPKVALFSGPTQIGSNDNWQEASNWRDIPTLFRLSNSAESAMLVTLLPGAYTAILSGVGSSPIGNGLIEVIDMTGIQVSSSTAGLFTGQTSQGSTCGPTSAWSGSECAARLFVDSTKARLDPSTGVASFFSIFPVPPCSSGSSAIAFVATCGDKVRFVQSCTGSIPLFPDKTWRLDLSSQETGTSEIIGNCFGSRCIGSLKMSFAPTGCSTETVLWGQ